MIIYTSAASSRLQYTVKFIESVIRQQIFIVTNKEEFIGSEYIKINYSQHPIDNTEYHIIPHGLLFQNNIGCIDITGSNCRDNKCFFINENGHHGFDVFACIFYLLSRYEEYLPHEKDIYGRFAHINSLAYKHDFLNMPLVNFWIQDLVNEISKHNKLALNPLHFTFLPTYDIDIAYSFNYQPIYKNLGGFFKDLGKGDIDKVIERANVYSGAKKDPFDVYDWLDGLHKKYNLRPVYFFLLAKKKGIYDKNIPPSSKAMQVLIQQHALKYTTGIHPSWQTGDDKTLVREEINSLEKITIQKCTHSRQHYIRLTLPETYRTLISNGIKEEYSMGYGSINGFRASVASPFYWYDLEKEEATELLVNPFCYMEANSHFEQHLSAEEARIELQYYHDIVKQVNGQLNTIFHNHFLTDQPQWRPWKEMYKNFLETNFK